MLALGGAHAQPQASAKHGIHRKTRGVRPVSRKMTRATISPALATIGALAACAVLVSQSPAATAPAPKPPYAYTGSVAEATSFSATAKARINPHGLATEYHFEYGPTTAYGAQTPPAPAGAGTQESAVAQPIAGLEAYTTYHYRVVATNSAGTTLGQDAAFATKRIPLSLTLAATPDPTVFGASLSVSGTLAGTGGPGAEVILQGSSFPYTHGFHNLTSPEPTSATGAFSFPITGLLESTQLRAATVAKPAIFSPVVTELVAVHVTLHARRTRRHGYVRLFGTVTPAAAGAQVAFEWLTSTHSYATVSGTTTKGSSSGVSRFARTVHLHARGLYRALVQITSGAQVAGRSQPLLIR